jgi:hypothetical protein
VRLINPGPGELLDRETILTIKIETGRLRGVPVEHFEREMDLVREALAPYRERSGSERWDSWRKDLLATNVLIWNAIDDLRAAKDEEHERAAAAGRRSMHGNDHRAAFIHAINAELGHQNGQEKL